MQVSKPARETAMTTEAPNFDVEFKKYQDGAAKARKSVMFQFIFGGVLILLGFLALAVVVIVALATNSKPDLTWASLMFFPMGFLQFIVGAISLTIAHERDQVAALFEAFALRQTTLPATTDTR